MNDPDIQDDPFSRMISIFKALEHYNRALALISLYIAQRADQNTIKGVTGIYNKLLGEEVTPGKVRGLLTSLVNTGLIERETEKLIGSTKVSFHQISPVGLIGISYIFVGTILQNPFEIEWDKNKFSSILHNQVEFALYNFLVESLMNNQKITKKFISKIKEGKDVFKGGKGKPLVFTIEKTLSGAGTAYRIFEEFLSDFLNHKMARSHTDLVTLFEGTSITSPLKKLGPLITVTTLGKTKYYRLSAKGIIMLPITTMLVRELAVDKSVFMVGLMGGSVDESENPWQFLVRQAIVFFKQLYS